MKKILLLISIIGAFLISSCSKDAKINKELQGEWTVITWNGDPLPTGVTGKMSFSKTERKKGNGTTTVTVLGLSFQQPFTYSIDDEKFIMNAAATTGLFAFPAINAVCSIQTHSKSEFVVTNDSDGKVYKLIK